MSLEQSPVGGAKNAASQDTNTILIAYADTYFGKRLFRQFLQNIKGGEKTGFHKVFACAWEKNGVHALVEEAVAAAARMLAEQESIGSAAAALEAAREASWDSLNGLPPFVPPPPTAATTVSVYDDDNVPARVFWRGDTMALRHAILQASHIVMEIRQAQDVFDMMYVLAGKELLKRKRIIVVSSLLTWYATPAIHMDNDSTIEGEGKRDNGAVRIFEDEEEEEEDEEGREEEPRPLDQSEVNALLGQFDVHGGGEEENNSNSMNDDNDEEAELNIEVLTEDQYNRRIPHAKYYNWREAERIVATANSDDSKLQTCVVFSGLQYGEGEDALEPFFTQVWNRENQGLPIYGSGSQIVPTVHVRDLVTFTQRLIEAEEPPALPYVFATDSGIVSWKRMVHAMNYAFGGEKTYFVPPEEYMFYNNVELFTLNLRVDNQTMRELMPNDEDWVSQSGFTANIAKVAFEYVNAHNLQPIRLAVLGPPLSGKTYLSEALAKRQYNLPTFTKEQVIEDYKAYIVTLKERLEKFRSRLYETEKKRREDAKKRALLKPRKSKDEEGEENEDQQEEVAVSNATQNGNGPAGGGSGGDDVFGGKKKKQRASGCNDESDIEEDSVEFTLTEEEVHAVEDLVEEWYNQNDRAIQLRDTIAAMERVLLMKVRLQPQMNADLANSNNPKKKKDQGKSKRGNRANHKKSANEEEDAANELQENAPFQDKALAIMMRWRMSRADCRNQGYVLDGFPETVAQARLLFGDGPLDIPETTEEAMAAGLPPSNEDGSGVGASEINIAPPTTEACEESRLPSFVFVLEVTENFLLNRLAALSKSLNDPPGGEEKRLVRFEEAMTTYRRQFVDTDYSLADFFECARTVPKTLTPASRGVTVSFLNVNMEPLLAPQPPESRFAVAPPSRVEQIVRHQVGKPHNFGPTPQQEFQEEERVRNLQEEERQKEQQAAMEQKEREKKEYIHESGERSKVESARKEIEEIDRKSLEKRKDPLRQYLQRNILPLLSKGLVEVCKTHPKDPVDFLAEWLMRHNPLDDSCFEL